MNRVFKDKEQWVFLEEEIKEYIKNKVNSCGYKTFELLLQSKSVANDNDNQKIVDSLCVIPISSRMHAQLLILGRKGKYGIYTLDDCNYYGGPGKYLNPENEAYPYDEIRISNKMDGICFVAFRKANKWGIEKIVDADYENPDEFFTYTYALTKRMVVVPCKFTSLELAQKQILNWIELPSS